jgi:hypothetical protein
MTLVIRSQALAIENLSEHQICEGFIKASRDINPTFYSQMKGRKINKPDLSIVDAVHTVITALVAEKLPSTITPSSSTMSISEPPTAFENALTALNALKQQHSQDTLKIRDCIRLYRETIPRSTSQRSHAAYGVTLGEEQLNTSELAKSQSIVSDTSRKQDQR